MIPTTAPAPGKPQSYVVWGSLTLSASPDTLTAHEDVQGSVDAEIGYLDSTTEVLDKKGHLRGSFSAKHCDQLDQVRSAAR